MIHHRLSFVMFRHIWAKVCAKYQPLGKEIDSDPAFVSPPFRKHLKEISFWKPRRTTLTCKLHKATWPSFPLCFYSSPLCLYPFHLTASTVSLARTHQALFPSHTHTHTPPLSGLHSPLCFLKFFPATIFMLCHHHAHTLTVCIIALCVMVTSDLAAPFTQLKHNVVLFIVLYCHTLFCYYSSVPHWPYWSCDCWATGIWGSHLVLVLHWGLVGGLKRTPDHIVQMRSRESLGCGHERSCAGDVICSGSLCRSEQEVIDSSAVNRDVSSIMNTWIYIMTGTA